MALGQRLEIRQGQSLVMTPQLQQAIKLLQLSNIELAEYCEAELEKNPLLERDESRAARSRSAKRSSAKIASERADESLAREDFSKVADLDQSAHENMYDGDESAPRPRAAAAGQPLTDWTTVRSASRFEGEEDPLESTVAGGGTAQGSSGRAAGDRRAAAGRSPDLPGPDRCHGRSRLSARRSR